MDLKERLLHNEIQHLGQIVQTLSYELIVIQDFIRGEFGPRFETYRKNYSPEGIGAKTSSIVPLGDGDQRVTRGKRKSGAQPSVMPKQERGEFAPEAEDDDMDMAANGDTIDSIVCEVDYDFAGALLESETNFDKDNCESLENLKAQIDQAEQPDGGKKGGRRKTRIWKYFDKVTLGEDKVTARCHKCNGLVSSRAARMVDHHLKCSKGIEQKSMKTRSRNYVAEIRNQVRVVKSQVSTNPSSGSAKDSATPAKKIGRAQDIIWKYFKEEVVNGHRKAKCLSCGDYISPKAGRLRHHKIACEEVGGTRNDAGEPEEQDDDQQVDTEPPQKDNESVESVKETTAIQP